jgi:hypothetical protein
MISSSGGGGSCSSETKCDRKTRPRPKLFVSAERLHEKRPQPRKVCEVLTLVKAVSLALQLISLEAANPKSSIVI